MWVLWPVLKSCRSKHTAWLTQLHCLHLSVQAELCMAAITRETFTKFSPKVLQPCTVALLPSPCMHSSSSTTSSSISPLPAGTACGLLLPCDRVSTPYLVHRTPAGRLQSCPDDCRRGCLVYFSTEQVLHLEIGAKGVTTHRLFVFETKLRKQDEWSRGGEDWSGDQPLGNLSCRHEARIYCSVSDHVGSYR